MILAACADASAPEVVGSQGSAVTTTSSTAGPGFDDPAPEPVGDDSASTDTAPTAGTDTATASSSPITSVVREQDRSPVLEDDEAATSPAPSSSSPNTTVALEEDPPTDTTANAPTTTVGAPGGNGDADPRDDAAEAPDDESNGQPDEPASTSTTVPDYLPASVRKWIPPVPSEEEMARRYAEYGGLREGWYKVNRDIPEPLTDEPIVLVVDEDWPQWESEPWDWSAGDPPQEYRNDPIRSVSIPFNDGTEIFSYTLSDVGVLYSQPVHLERGSLITSERLTTSYRWAPNSARIAIVTAVVRMNPLIMEIAYCGGGNHEWVGTQAYRTNEGLRVMLGGYSDGDFADATAGAGSIGVCG